LIFSATTDYFHGLIAEKYRGKWQSKAALISSVTINLFLLGFFKYSVFIIRNINFILNTSIPYNEPSLPIGISFYTFQTISYVFDVYKGEVEAQKSYYKLLLFVSLFHQLVAGPIVRYKDICRSIDRRVIGVNDFSKGISRFVVGLGKKVLFANTAGKLAVVFLDGDIVELSVLGAWFGITLFALQIYYDFSGYSDMAIGLGKMFGFKYKENFDYPYISRSATEFWRRWHISLGSFFRDYLYIPLGGNQKHHIRNLLIVWILTGLWHGSSWNFVIWGLYYGLLIMFEKIVSSKRVIRVPTLIKHFYLILIVLIGWVFFYFVDLKSAVSVLLVMFGYGSNGFVSPRLSIYFMNNVIFFFIAIVGCCPIVNIVRELALKNEGKYKKPYINGYEVLLPAFNLVLLIISTILLVGKSYNPFLYFRF
jgi:alginate O-acetyltransferase complex protein AlgI